MLLHIEELFSLEHTLAGDWLQRMTYPWELLGEIGEMILALGERLEGYRQICKQVWVHPSAVVEKSALVEGPCIIGPDTQLRQGAYIRGNALMGSGCVVGNSTELKNAILFDGAQVPHFNYVGDSILGYKAHLGAGAICSNVRGDKGLVTINGIFTGRKKVGAMVGDLAEVGCHAVLNPGTIIGKGARVYPVSSVRGIVPAAHIYKNDGTIIAMKK